MQRSTTPWSLLRSRIVLITVLMAIAYAAQAIVREAQSRRAVQREIRTMEETAAKLDAQRTRLTDLLERTNDPEFVEREARLRLGLQKPGESVYIVRPETLGQGTAPPPNTSQRPSNPTKWWQRLFR